MSLHQKTVQSMYIKQLHITVQKNTNELRRIAYWSFNQVWWAFKDYVTVLNMWTQAYVNPTWWSFMKAVILKNQQWNDKERQLVLEKLELWNNLIACN